MKKTGDLTSTVQHSTVTDDGGWYRFTDLASGSYQIEVRTPSGTTEHYKKTLSSQGEWDFEVKSKS